MDTNQIVTGYSNMYVCMYVCINTVWSIAKYNGKEHHQRSMVIFHDSPIELYGPHTIGITNNHRMTISVSES